uniref:Spliceosome-associated protein CWC27 homolog n=1 Tax=Cebus imitator TaxID=2715852 RepID=A0A2K5RKX1_CEBIM
MSNIYIQEPPTNGKVLLKTTAGDIDIELWSKEAPKACRNFIQLCLEAYYDNTIFHRVVPGFIVQGGDPTGTGTGGESIYGTPFKDEFHSRLRFNRRGLVAMANAGSHDNGSQFFFTLGRADELNNKHTIFGKVTGDTVYNMLRLSEVDIDDEERPRNPHKIKSCEVLFNPFDDIIPREIKRPKKEKPEEEVKKLKPKGTKNFSLLSFGEEAEEEEEEVNRVSQSMKGKSKSSHDLLKDDPHLSSVPVVESEKGDASGDSDDEELRKEARQLKRELLAAKQKKVENASKQAEKAGEEEEATPDGAIAEYRREKQKCEALRKQQSKKGTSREDQTLALLNQFKSKLTQAIAETPENDTPETEVEDDEGWMSHVLQFEDKSRKVKDASMQDSDTFEIYDPRNPVNKRRREESKKLMREKKERR